MKLNRPLNTTLIFGVFALSMSAQAAANSVGVGIGVATEYPGSDEYAFSPNAAFEIDTPIGILKNNQIGVQLDLVKSTSIDTGPILRANFGRPDTISDVVVAALDEVPAAAELGWFVGSGFKLSQLGLNSGGIVIGRLSAVTDVSDGHGGTSVAGNVGLVMQITDNFRLVPTVGFNYADDSYTDSFYSVNSSGAQASGLSEFKASGGLEYTQLALFALRTIDEHWTVTGTLAYTTLQNDAASSPITQRGTDKQAFTGFIVHYAF